MLIISSGTDLSLNCSPTDMKWFDRDHVSGLSRSFDECHGYPSLVPLRSSGVSSTSFIPCSCRPNPFLGVYPILRRISHGFFMCSGKWYWVMSKLQAMKICLTVSMASVAWSLLKGVSDNASVVVGTATRCASASIGSSPNILIIFPWWGNFMH